MNGKKAKRLRSIAKAAGVAYAPAGYDEVNVKMREEEDPVRGCFDSEGVWIPVVYRVQTRTLVRKSCGKSLVRMLKGTKADKELKNGC